MSKVQTGIWIDSREALIFTMRKDSEHFERIASEVEESRIPGEGKSATSFAVRDALKEKRKLRRRTEQFERFYNRILTTVGSSSEILICGPGESKLGLEKAILKKENRDYQLIGCHTLDSLTENQIRAWIREKFGLRH